jgi:hypothetical protein
MENQFLVLGHATEKYQTYEERKKIPEGYTLLLKTECDRPTYQSEVEKVIEIASQTPLDLSSFRVYKEGDPYPSLKLLLLDDIEVGKVKGAEYFGLIRSGVYKLPISLDDFKSHDEWIEKYWIHDDKNSSSRYYYLGESIRIPKSKLAYSGLRRSLLMPENALEKDLVEFQYEGAHYPKKAALKEYLKSSPTLEDLKEKLTISVEDLFEKLGPGTYLIPLCRTVRPDIPNQQELFDYIEAEIYPDLDKRLNMRYNHNKIKYKQQKLELLNSLKNHPKLANNSWKSKVNSVRKNLKRAINVVKNTRSKSVERQRNKTKKN